MNDELELLRHYAKSGSQQAFSELVRLKLDLVYSAALRQVAGDVHRAEDVAQEVFATLARKARSLEGHPHLTGWLFLTTRYAAQQIVRTEARRRAREMEASRMIEMDQTDTAEADWERIRPLLDRTLEQLKVQDRSALLLRFFERKTYGEMATQLRVSDDSARMRVERALERARLALARLGVRSTAGALAALLTDHAVAAAPAGLASRLTLASSAIGTGAATESAASVHFLSLMTSSKASLSLMSALAVVVAGGAAYEKVLADHSAARAEAAANAYHRLSPEGATAPAKTPGSRLPQTSSPETEPRRGSSPLPSTSRSQNDPLQESPLAHNPQYRTLALAKYQAALASAYGPFTRTAGLTSEQTAAVQKLLFDTYAQKSASDDRFLLSQSDPNELFKTAAFSAALSQIIGPTGAAQFNDYVRSRGARQSVDYLAGNSLFAGAALDSGQVDALSRIVADASGSYRTGSDWNAADVDWDRVLQQASGVINSTQLSVARSVIATRLMNETADQAATLAQSSGH